MAAEAELQHARRALELLRAGTVQDGFTRIVVSRQVQYVVVALPDEDARARLGEEAATLRFAVAGERRRAEQAELALAGAALANEEALRRLAALEAARPEAAGGPGGGLAAPGVAAADGLACRGD